MSRTSFEDFDPNAAGKDQPVWAVYNNARFKTFVHRGHALASMAAHYRTKLYKWECGGWRLVAVWDEANNPDTCTECGGTTFHHPYSYGLGARDSRLPQRNEGRYRWRRDLSTRKISDPVDLMFLCPSCQDAYA